MEDKKRLVAVEENLKLNTKRLDEAERKIEDIHDFSSKSLFEFIKNCHIIYCNKEATEYSVASFFIEGKILYI